jgi:putative ABC transport system permease protein
MIEALLQDLRFGVRMLRKNIGFTVAAVLTLGLAIGANTAIFSVAQAVFFRSSTSPDADRLMYVSRGYPGFPEGGGNFSYPAYRDMLQQNFSFVDFAAYQRFGSQVLTDGAEPVRIKVNFITPSYLSLQGVKPVIGRLLRPEEDRFGDGDPVMVLSYGFWQRQFAGSPDVIGRSIHVNQHAFTVVGVTSAEFFDPLGQQDTSEVVDAYAPLGLAYPLTGYSDPTNRHRALTWGVGLRKPGVSVEQARADIAAIGDRLGRAYPTTDRGYTLVARPLKDQLVGEFYSPMWLLIGGSIFILLIGCANVANLLLIRFAARQREFAVRSALGATGKRLARQMFVESFTLVMIAAVLGALMAVWGVAGLRSWGRLNLPQLIQIRVDPWMLAASGLISIVTGFLFGLVPSLAGSRVDLRDALSQGGKQGSGIGHRRAAKALVISEVCLAVVLLAGAGLLLKSLYRLTTIDLGFNTKNLLTLRLDLIGERYSVTAKRTLFAKDLIQRLEALPGVQSASVWGPGMIGRATWVIEGVAEGRPVSDPRNIIGSSVHDVNPGALHDLGITILRGRDFTWQDDENAPAVAIISESAAKAYWPGEDALGKRLRSTSDPQLITVVGIASDARMRQRFYCRTPPSARLPPGSVRSETYIFLTPKVLTQLS